MLFFAPDATDANPTRIWDNVYLGELFGHNRWMQFLFTAMKSRQPTPSIQRSKVVNAIMIPLLGCAFRSGMAVLTKYHQQNDGCSRCSQVRRVPRQRPGSPWCARATDWHAESDYNTLIDWQRFLDPVQPRDDIGSRSGNSFGASANVGIHSLVLTVTSLTSAHSFIADHNLQAKMMDGCLQLMLPETDGLTIELTEDGGSP